MKMYNKEGASCEASLEQIEIMEKAGWSIKKVPIVKKAAPKAAPKATPISDKN